MIIKPALVLNKTKNPLHSSRPKFECRRRELFEIQANREMIRSILKEELSACDKDDVKNFNYVRFMEKYDLVTTLDEELVKEEFLKLIS